jgi:hypothetical protein
MNQMVILPSALANQTRQIPEAVNIFSYLLPQPVECPVSKKIIAIESRRRYHQVSKNITEQIL